MGVTPSAATAAPSSVGTSCAEGPIPPHAVVARTQIPDARARTIPHRQREASYWRIFPRHARWHLLPRKPRRGVFPICSGNEQSGTQLVRRVVARRPMGEQTNTSSPEFTTAHSVVHRVDERVRVGDQPPTERRRSQQVVLARRVWFRRGQHVRRQWPAAPNALSPRADFLCRVESPVRCSNFNWCATPWRPLGRLIARDAR